VTVLKNILNICQQKNYVSMSGENLDLNKKVQKIVDMLSQNQPESNSSLIIAGPSVFSHPNASSLLSLLSQIAEELKCRFALLPSGGNVSGGFLAKALPESDGYNTTSMFDNANSAFLLLNVEPAKDLNFGLHAVKTMKQSKVGVVAMTSFKSSVADFATVMLPISPFTESAGTYINMEGRAQNVRPVADSQGSSRPAWKILRVMGNLLGIEEFKYENIKDVQKLFSNKINDDSFIKDFNFIVNKKNTINPNNNYEKNTLEFTSFFPIYLSDQIVRRSESLLKTSQSIKPSFRINPKSLDHLSFLNGDIIKLKLTVGLKSEYIEGKYSVDFSVAEGVVAIGQGHPDQNNFSTMNQLVSVVVD
jgi:NADH-quinone oxidoreductase subunit G